MLLLSIEKELISEIRKSNLRISGLGDLWDYACRAKLLGLGIGLLNSQTADLFKVVLLATGVETQNQSSVHQLPPFKTEQRKTARHRHRPIKFANADFIQSRPLGDGR